jgi:hypothetical protein
MDEVRRHVRIFIDLGRVASESADEYGFLDQVVVQVARAVEIDHVSAAGKPTYSSPPASGGKRALYGRLPCLPICGRRRAARSRPPSRS